MTHALAPVFILTTGLIALPAGQAAARQATPQPAPRTSPAPVKPAVRPSAAAPGDPEAGVSRALARDRTARIGEVRYEISFNIPAAATEPIKGTETLRFAVKDAQRPVVIDFAQPMTQVVSARANASPVALRSANGHLIVPAAALRAGENTLSLELVAADATLNRNPGFLYTLFEPDRASSVFPCFDQPDLRARFTLSLEVPSTWQALANSGEQGREARGDRTLIRFAPTEPIPTYLFAFAAGELKVETAVRDGRTYRLFFRGAEATDIARNRDAIFDQHAAALQWMERYTAVPYPWGKVDILILPGSPFAGLAHPGAVFYDSALLLDESPTRMQELERTSTIAHETAHFWFGDLVTPTWFDDLWLKEALAGVMAAKIVSASVTGVDGDIHFLLAHQPAAYDVDRSAKPNPLRQPLDNLKNAGALYGAITFRKAPVVMRQIETFVGSEPFQEGLKLYLKQHAFGNAAWSDLLGILREQTAEDLESACRVWLEAAGRPIVQASVELSNEGDLATLLIKQRDRDGRALIWVQNLEPVLGYNSGTRRLSMVIDGQMAGVSGSDDMPAPRFVLSDGGTLGYGLFLIDPASRDFLMTSLPEITDPLIRAAAWLALWDGVLELSVSPDAFIELALRALPVETSELTAEQILGRLVDVYWRFLPPDQREVLAVPFESAFWRGVEQARTPTLKAAYFRAFRRVAVTPDSVLRLQRIWRLARQVPGMTLSERDYIDIALELAVRQVEGWQEMLVAQQGRIDDPYRKAEFEFIMPAVSADRAVRDRFVASLANAAGRRHEAWVIDGLTWLNHPLRGASSEKYLRPSLERLEEVQRTGSALFPKQWLDASFAGHNTESAVEIILDFVEEQSTYPPQLLQIILQSSDALARNSLIANASVAIPEK